MQVWRDTQTGLRERWYQDIVSMYLAAMDLISIECGAI